MDVFRYASFKALETKDPSDDIQVLYISVMTVEQGWLFIVANLLGDLLYILYC